MASSSKTPFFDESEGQKLLRKARENPALPIGITGLLMVVLYGAYKYRTKTLKTSIYLIHLRVAAQGTVIGSLCAGLAYSMFKKHVLHDEVSTSNDN